MAKKEQAPSPDAELEQLSLADQEPEETEAPAEAPPELPAEPPVTSFAAELRRRGYEVADDADDDDVFSYLEERERAAEQAEQLRQELEQRRAELEQFRQQASHKPEETPAEPEVVESEFPKRPQLDGSVRDILTAALQSEKPLVEQTAGGFLRAVDASMTPFVQKYNEFVQAEKEYRQPFEEDPYGFIQSTLEKQRSKLLDPVQQELESLKQQLADLKQARTTDATDAFWEKHANHYFAKDADGSFVVDEQNRHVGTPAWDEYVRAAEEAKRFGVPEENIHAYAAEKSLAFEPEADTPPKKRVKFRNRLKQNNGRIQQTPVERPAASPQARAKGENIDQKLSGLFKGLMSEGVAERI